MNQCNWFQEHWTQNQHPDEWVEPNGPTSHWWLSSRTGLSQGSTLFMCIAFSLLIPFSWKPSTRCRHWFHWLAGRNSFPEFLDNPVWNTPETHQAIHLVDSAILFWQAGHKRIICLEGPCHEWGTRRKVLRHTSEKETPQSASSYCTTCTLKWMHFFFLVYPRILEIFIDFCLNISTLSFLDF